MSRLKSIEEEWDGFSEMIFARTDPSDIQRKEMRKAFFAGAWAMLTACQIMSEPDVPEEECVAYLNARRAECEAFGWQILGAVPGRCRRS